MSNFLSHQLCMVILPFFLSCFIMNSQAPADNSEEIFRNTQRAADIFPYGFWVADACYTAQAAAYFDEPYQGRMDKTLADLSKNYVNAVIFANRAITKWHLDTAGKYGIKSISQPNYLAVILSNAGPREGVDMVTGIEKVKQQWREHAKEFGKDPNLLAWHVFDEPAPACSPYIKEVTDMLKKEFPGIPVMVTHQSLPLGSIPSEKELIESLDFQYSDCYSVHSPFGRDPWLYGDFTMKEFRRAAPNSIYWPTIQSFHYQQDITVPELGIMIYNTIAKGAKGMWFFTNGHGMIMFGHFKTIWPGSGTPWFGSEKLLSEIGRIGKHIVSAGPLILKLQYQPDYPVVVNSELVYAKVGEYLRNTEEISFKAIQVGVYTGDEYDILIVHNNDNIKEQSGTVTIDPKGKILFDLKKLEPVKVDLQDGKLTFRVTYRAGDGGMYMLADQKTYELARRQILSRLYEREMIVFDIDAAPARAAKIDMAKSDQAIAAARQQAAEGNYTEAMATIEVARKYWQQSIKTDTTYTRTVQSLDAMRNEFEWMHDWAIDHGDYVRLEPIMPKMKKMIDVFHELSIKFTALDNAWRQGKLDANECEALQDKVIQLKKEFRDFRPFGRMKHSVAVIVADEKDIDATALADWIKLTVEKSDTLSVDPKLGLVVSGTNRQADLSQYDMVWFHIGGESEYVNAPYCQNASIDYKKFPVETIKILRNYIDNKGDLVLSGLGCLLVNKLNLEPTIPNETYWGVMYSPAKAVIQWEARNVCGKGLGYMPKVKDHPIFKGLNSSGFIMAAFDNAEMISKAVWRQTGQTNLLQKGKILAGYYSDGAQFPDIFATIVEFPTKGKVLAIGDCFDPYIGARGEACRTIRKNTDYDKFIKNVIKYCSGVSPEK